MSLTALMLGAALAAGAAAPSPEPALGPISVQPQGPSTGLAIVDPGAEPLSGHKVLICHVPPGDPANAHEITVSQSAVAAHLAHGDTLGPCQQAGGCSNNADCAPEEYCAKAPGNCDGQGQCELRPEICIALFDPVCGCDGQTYSNSCVAASNGVNVKHAGECETVK